MNKYTPAVKRGIEFLNENGPLGWHKAIELESLDLANCEACILGQLYGWVSDGEKQLGLEGDRSIELGFDTNENDEYELLTEALLFWFVILTN